MSGNIWVHSRHTPEDKLAKKYPGARVIDVTSRAPEPWVRLSPFYPHGDIPVPLSSGHTSESVEGLWQALKVFESEGIDLARMQNTTMKGLKRTVRKYGAVLGHRAGVDGEDLLGYIEARWTLYLPAYHWVLEHKTPELVEELRAAHEAGGDIVLLDYETNGDVEDPRKPLSHAWLVAYAAMGQWPVRPDRTP